MNSSACFFSAVLLSLLIFFPLSGKSDFTLVYADLEVPVGEAGETGEPKPVSAQRIYICDHALAVETHGESRVTLFDRDAGTVRLIDHDAEIYIDMDTVLVRQLSERLSITERKVLDGFEERISKAPKEEKKKLRKILDEIHAAHNYQLSKPPEFVYRDAETTETIDDIEAEGTDAYLNDFHRARYFLADHKKLGMTQEEHRTLQEFQDFMRDLAKHTPGALQRNFGDLSMLTKSGKIPIKVRRINPDGTATIQQLAQHHDRDVDAEWFRIPEHYQAATLRPTPAKKEEQRAPAAVPGKG